MNDYTGYAGKPKNRDIPKVSMNLVEAVEVERKKRGLNHRGLCQLLGIDDALWHRVRTGEYKPTRKFLMSVMAKLPELGLVVIDYMRNAEAKGEQ